MEEGINDRNDNKNENMMWEKRQIKQQVLIVQQLVKVN